MQGAHVLSSEVDGGRALSFFRGLPFSGVTLFSTIQRPADKAHQPDEQTL
jgi:hypothetical protein